MNTDPKYRDLIEGEHIHRGDEYLPSGGSWLSTACHGDIYSPTYKHGNRHLPHRRLILTHKPTPMSTTPTHTYRILRDTKTKPVRFIVLIDGKIYVEGVTQAIAREIVAGHMLRVHPDITDLQRKVVDHIHSSGI
jgi:hypothetical protein